MTTENENQTSAPAPAPTGPGGFVPRGPRPGGFVPRGPRPGGFGGGDNAEGGQDGGRPGAPRRPRRGAPKDRFAPRRKVCQFCVDKIKEVDYKDFQRLRRYLSDRGKIEPRRKTGTCARHQRSMTVAIKRARFLALLPYVADRGR